MDSAATLAVRLYSCTLRIHRLIPGHTCVAALLELSITAEMHLFVHGGVDTRKSYELFMDRTHHCMSVIAGLVRLELRIAHPQACVFACAVV